MPIVKSGAGISSYNEMFAMKKNLAFEAKFEHHMSSMTRDFFHKRENLKHEIRTVYGDMKNIKRSTGYSLDQVRSGRSPRKPNAPTIYLPPIGLRLVKKYVGLDFKRMSLAGDAGEQRRLSNVINNAFNLQRGPAYSLDTGERQRDGQGNDVVDIERISPYDRSTSSLKSASQSEKVGSASSLLKREVSLHLLSNGSSTLIPIDTQTKYSIQESGSKVQQEPGTNLTDKNTTTLPPIVTGIVKEPNLDESVLRQTNITGTFDLKREETGMSNVTTNGTDESTTIGGDHAPEKFNLNTTYNLTERRSSRSTFRARSSARVPSERSHLSNYNMEVIGLKNSDRASGAKTKKTAKPIEKIGPFYLDYGDGKLHDNMEIPKFKDCARPWCSPHCKTCQNRTTGRPCFVIVPVDDSFRRRKLPVDKRRTSMFPVLPAAKKLENPDVTNENETNKTGKQDKTREKDCKVVSPRDGKSVSDAENMSPRSAPGQDSGEANHESKSTIESSDPNRKLTDYLQERKNFLKKEKSYSKKRLEELAQPRGGRPAEVRFSKMTLRKEQEQMIETERRKALTKYEQDNLSFIQGKISLFLALLNQQELTGKPGKMVDLPLREKLSGKRKKKNKNTTSLVRLLKHGRGHRGVTFSPNPRYRLMS